METVLICLIICTIYSLIIYNVLSRRINKKIDNQTFLNDVREEIGLLITQINETSDRNVLLLENRLERLNSLLSESDKKISILKRNISSTKVEEVEDSSDTDSVTGVIESSSESHIVEKEEQVEEVVNDSYIADETTLSQKERILLLHKQGISSSIIASQTKSSIGEVELIISLNKG